MVRSFSCSAVVSLLLVCKASKGREESCAENRASDVVVFLQEEDRSRVFHQLRQPLLPTGALAPEDGHCDSTNEEKVIFVNSLYPSSISLLDGHLLPDCPMTCKISTDRSALASADAVVWNARWMEPVGNPPHTKRDCQRWVFSFYEEAAIYNGAKVASSTSAAFGDKIDWTMTYRPDSDFFQPMYRLSSNEGGEATLAAAISTSASKPNLLLWLASNCDAAQGTMKRKLYFETLKQRLPAGRVHTYGKCGQEMPCPRRDKLLEDPDECEEQFFGQYKFYAALENSRCTGYVTEKFARAYRFGMVPVVVGGQSRKDYEAIAPADSFIHIDDFPSTQALADYLLELDRDDAAYNTFFAWRSHFSLSPKVTNDVQPYCELCQELHKPRSDQKLSRGSVVQWWYDDTCDAEAYPSKLFE